LHERLNEIERLRDEVFWILMSMLGIVVLGTLGLLYVAFSVGGI